MVRCWMMGGRWWVLDVGWWKSELKFGFSIGRVRGECTIALNVLVHGVPRVGVQVRGVDGRGRVRCDPERLRDTVHEHDLGIALGVGLGTTDHL